MAISPKELIQREKEETDEIIAELEGKIDKLLLENYQGPTMPVEIPVGKIFRAKGDTKGILEIAIENYIKAGWTVDQRPDKYVFTAQK